MLNSPVATLADMLSHLLDRDFIKQAGPVLALIANDPRVRSAVAELQREAERLQTANEALTRTNPAIGNVRGAVEASINNVKPQLASAGIALEAGAIVTGATMAHQMALSGGLQGIPA